MVEHVNFDDHEVERKDKDTELVVNLGLFLEKYSGNSSLAAEYMIVNEVPGTVIERVLLHPELRRKVPVSE